jgi:hypothetical protein
MSRLLGEWLIRPTAVSTDLAHPTAELETATTLNTADRDGRGITTEVDSRTVQGIRNGDRDLTYSHIRLLRARSRPQAARSGGFRGRRSPRFRGDSLQSVLLTLPTGHHPAEGEIAALLARRRARQANLDPRHHRAWPLDAALPGIASRSARRVLRIRTTPGLPVVKSRRAGPSSSAPTATSHGGTMPRCSTTTHSPHSGAL